MNTESKTPRTDDQSVRYYDDATGTRIEYVAARFARQLELELAQRNRERDEARATCSELVTDSDAITLARTVVHITQERDEARKERDEASKSYVNAVNQLATERALADRLAELLELYHHERDWPSVKALDAWKEAWK